MEPPLSRRKLCFQDLSHFKQLSAAPISRLPEEECTRVPEDMTGAFVSESSQIAYPIVGRIACFLEQTSLRLAANPSLERDRRDAENLSVQQSVKRWYDEFGWLRNESGLYNDTALHSQASVTAHGIYELDSHLSLLDRFSGGTSSLTLLAVQFPMLRNSPTHGHTSIVCASIYHW